jgi:hypothetical protein
MDFIGYLVVRSDVYLTSSLQGVGCSKFLPIVVNYNNVICLQCPVEFKRALLPLLHASSSANVRYMYFMDLGRYIKYSLNLGLR